MEKLTAKSLVKTPLQKSLKGKAGYLTDREIELAYHQGIIHTPRTLMDNQIQPVSLDLRLGHNAYRIQSSFLPENDTVEQKLKDLKLYEVDLRDGGILEKGAIYLIPLLEELDLPAGLFGCTNPKSSTGRLDMFTRVIIDHGHRFDEITPGYKGKLYLEVLSRSFPVRVQEGITLNQLRLKHGNAEIADSQLKTLYKKKPILYHKSGGAVEWDKVKADDGLFISVDLQGANRKNSIVAYKAKANSQVVDLTRTRHYHADDFWEPVYYPKRHRLILEPESFYIMMSKEKICIWPDLVSEMVAYEPNSGELRTHYAGFFDPGFGHAAAGGAGSRGVLEVRCHEAPFVLEHGQIVGRLVYERMDEVPEQLYGADIASNYQGQGLKLSKHFKT